MGIKSDGNEWPPDRSLCGPHIGVDDQVLEVLWWDVRSFGLEFEGGWTTTIWIFSNPNQHQLSCIRGLIRYKWAQEGE